MRKLKSSEFGKNRKEDLGLTSLWVVKLQNCSTFQKIRSGQRILPGIRRREHSEQHGDATHLCSGMRGPWLLICDGALCSEGLGSVFSLSPFPPRLNSSVEEHWDLYSVFLKLLSVLFDIWPGLDNWGVLLFFLFYVVRLQYFSPTFLTLLKNPLFCPS